MKEVYIGPIESLGPSGFLDVSWDTYRKGSKALRAWSWNGRDYLLGRIPEEILGENTDFWQMLGPERSLLAIKRLCGNLKNIWRDHEYDSVYIGGGRLRPIRPPGEPNLTGMPEHFLREVQSILSECGFQISEPEPVFIESSCVTGIALLDLARKRILADQAKRILIISFDTLQAAAMLLMDKFGILSSGDLSEYPQAWTSSRDGFARSEAVSAVVVSAKPSEQNPLALLSTAISADAMGITSMDPQGKGLSTAIESCISEAGCDEANISLIKAHATGTTMNDKVESAVLQACCSGKLRTKGILAFKPQFGHTMNASVLFELTLLGKCLEHKEFNKILPINFEAGDHSPQAPVISRNGFLVLGLAMGFGGINGAYLVRLGKM